MASRNLVNKVAEELLRPGTIGELKEFYEGKLKAAMTNADAPTARRIGRLIDDIEAAEKSAESQKHALPTSPMQQSAKEGTDKKRT